MQKSSDSATPHRPARKAGIPAFLLLIGALLCLAAAPAQAARVHSLLLSETLPNEARPLGVAVNQTTHHFYVTSFNSDEWHLNNFDPDGKLDPTTPELIGTPGVSLFMPAVDNSGGPRNGYIYATNAGSEIQQFDPTGTATAVKITGAAIPPDGTAQGGGLPPVVNTGEFRFGPLAVGPSGNVFVGESRANAVDEFTPAGAFVTQLAAGSISGGTEGIAIDSASHIYLASDNFSGLGEGLFELDSTTGSCVQAGCAPIDPAPISGVAVDHSSGRIFTTALVSANNGYEGKFSEYDAAGTLLGVTHPRQLHSPFGIGIDEASGKVIVADTQPSREATLQIYGPVAIVPDVQTEAAEEVSDHSASFHGKIGAAEVPGATCAFQYVDAEGFAAHGFQGAAEAPCEPAGPFSGSAMNEVHAEVEGLRGGDTYHYRLLGSNENGPNTGEDIPFTTKGPAISEEEASEVTENGATLRALIDPRGSEAATYAFQYLTQAQFEASGWAGASEVPAGGAPIPLSASGTGDLEAGSSAIGKGALVAGSNEITALSTEEGAFEVGQPIVGEGIPAETTITALSPGALVMSAPAQSSGTGVALAAGSRVITALLTEEGAFKAGQTIAGPGIAADTKVLRVSAGGQALVLSAEASQTLAGAPLVSTEVLAASQRIEGLNPDTPYRFRVAATIASGELTGLSFGAGGSFTTFAPSSAGLPDGRAYEQASPVDKNGANVEGEFNAVQASPDGNRITFFSSGGIPGGEGEQDFPSYLATRAPDASGWSTQGLLPPASSGSRARILGWTEDLSETYEFASPAFEGAQLLARKSDGGSLTVVGTTGKPSTNVFAFAGASAGGAVALVKSEAGGVSHEGSPLPDLPGVQNLYAYDREAGDLVVAGVMNDGSVPAGGAAGVGGFTQATHAISADGTKAFFTAGTPEQLYVRVNPFAEPAELPPAQCLAGTKACTVRISAAEVGVSDPATPAVFLGASADGHLVYFLDQGKLTTDATGGSGYDLYRYDLSSGDLTDLSLDSADKNGAQVEGMLGIGASGEDAYFVAAGALAEGAEKAPSGETNLYALHGSAIEFLTRLGTGEAEALNWILGSVETGGLVTTHTARLSADGQTLLFTSARQLTSYRNHGRAELYRYRAGEGINCVSCNPSGEAPAGPAGVQQIPSKALAPKLRFSIMTRNLSADGRRVIFDSADHLVSADENNVNDVYEWEEKGEGSCDSEAQDGGCLFLISSGTGSAPSYLADTDAEGENAFFFTEDQLLAQDKDELLDVYDARVGGGIASQNEPPVPPCEGEACPGQGSSGRAVQTPGTSTFAGPGNPARPPGCGKGRARKHGRCVKQGHAKKKHSKKHHKRRAQRAKGGSGR